MPPQHHLQTTPPHRGVLRLTLDRPDKKNALTPETLHALAQTLESPPEDTRAVLLDGRGDVFCAGFDLLACRDNPDTLTHLLTTLSLAVQAMKNCPAPIVAAAHGAAIAGGCALLTGADFVITDDNAKLGYPVVRLGISPAVTAPSLAAAVGHGRTRKLLLEGRLIDGLTAASIGLAHASFSDPGLACREAERLAHELAKKPQNGLRATKNLLKSLEKSAAPDDFARALGVSTSLVGTPEQRDRLSALWQRSEPRP